jgi:hypothetical protein
LAGGREPHSQTSNPNPGHSIVIRVIIRIHDRRAVKNDAAAIRFVRSEIAT